MSFGRPGRDVFEGRIGWGLSDYWEFGTGGNFGSRSWGGAAGFVFSEENGGNCGSISWGGAQNQVMSMEKGFKALKGLVEIGPCIFLVLCWIFCGNSIFVLVL